MRRFLLIVLSIGLIGTLGYIFVLEKQERDAMETRIEQLTDMAKDYQEEIQTIEDELEVRRAQLTQVPESTEVAIGCVPRSVADLDTVREKFSGNNKKPVIILNCAMQEEVLTEILQASQEEGYELVLAGLTYDDQVLATAKKLAEKINEAKGSASIPFLLRKTCDSKEHRSELMSQGYKGLILYSDEIETGVLDNGVPYISYLLINNNGQAVTAVRSALDARTKVLIAFHLQTLEEDPTLWDTEKEILDLVDEYMREKTAAYTSVDAMLDAVSTEEEAAAKRNEEFMKYEEEQRERIQELQEQINAIYSQWHEQ